VQTSTASVAPIMETMMKPTTPRNSAFLWDAVVDGGKAAAQQQQTGHVK
jgi:hypothetical protein